MKILNILFILFLLIMSSCKNPKGEIEYIDIYTTTARSISCENLKKAKYKKKVLLSTPENHKLLKLITTLKPADSDWNIDARLYGFVYDGSEKLNFCMSTTIIEINNKKFFVDDELRDYIVKLTN